MRELVLEYMQRQHMIEPGDHVIAGVSGGADSVCLLLILEALREALSFTLTVVHVEHGVRGKESLKDAQFVENLCESRKIPCRVFSVDMMARAREAGLSPEEAGRILRYECFRQVCQETGANKIAVAHHRDDQAETVLQHLLRGAGLRGLCGMAPVRKEEVSGISVIRPLLETGRGEIEQWLKKQGISWCTDKTNEEAVYTRNILRLHVLPLIEAQVQTQAGVHIAQTAGRMRMVQEYLDRQAERAYGACVQGTEDSAARVCLKLAHFLQLEPLMQTMVLQLALEKLGRGLKDISAIHLETLLELAHKETGKSISLPAKVRGRREYECLILEYCPDSSQPSAEQCGQETCIEKLQIPGTYEIQGCTWQFSLENAKKCMRIPEKTYTKWFDYDKIVQCLSLRTRKPGDYLEINRDLGRKKLKDYFIDCKVPREEREQMILLTEGSHVLWIPGMRISEAYKVTEQTERLLKVELFRRITND